MDVLLACMSSLCATCMLMPHRPEESGVCPTTQVTDSHDPSCEC